MNINFVCDIAPTADNPRNSEGSFLRAPNGDILYAYSRFNGKSCQDEAPSDIAMIRSSDEGESFTDTPIIIARAASFGVKNIMSVSGLKLKDGRLAFYYLIKENDGSSSLGRAISSDGVNFTNERIPVDTYKAFYVINNDRIERFADGRIVIPVSQFFSEDGFGRLSGPSTTMVWVSEDDGSSFKVLPGIRLTHNANVNIGFGLQEPGIIELSPGFSWMWMRTGACYQYQSFSFNNLKSFTPPEPTSFTSPDSPMEIIRQNENTLYAVYNPVPKYNGQKRTSWGWGRTPLVIRKSTDNGLTFGDLHIIEDGERGFCYPSMFFTNDGKMLCAYCRGGKEDVSCLCRVGIVKIDISQI